MTVRDSGVVSYLRGKLLRFFSKYGGLFAPINFLHWKMFLYCKAREGDEVLAAPGECFQIVIKSKFRELYQGGLEEYQRVKDGERKVLFYDDRDMTKKTDIKTSWELKRFHHAAIIAVHAGENRQSLLSELFNEVSLRQVCENSNAMEVGISAINVITTYSLLTDDERSHCQDVVSKHIQACLAYILKNCEKGILYSNNHYFFNLLSVLWICEAIVGNPLTARIRKNTYQALSEFLSEVILADGSLYEGSTHYHKYVTEAFLLFLHDIDNAGSVDSLRSFAERMVQFIQDHSAGGKIIGVGDNDSGRLLPLPAYFDYDSSDLAVIKILANRLGLNDCASSVENHAVNDNFGLYVLKSGQMLAAVRLEAGKRKYRKTIGSHSHNDQLHLTVFFKDNPILIEKGTYSYVQDQQSRIENIKTSSHNTVLINEYEQNIIYNDWNYHERLHDGKVIISDAREFRGCYYDIMHNFIARKIFLQEQGGILDEFQVILKEINGHDEIQVSYHFHPDFFVQHRHAREAVFHSPLFDVMIEPDAGKLLIEDYSFSPEYGTRLAAKVLRLIVPVNGQNNIQFNVRISVTERLPRHGTSQSFNG